MYELKVTLPSVKTSLIILDQCMSDFTHVFSFEKEKGFLFAMHEAIINAIQAAERMEKPEKEQLTVRITADDQNVCGYVTDTCGGIPEDKKKEIRTSSFEDVMSFSGRGFLLINHFVDHVECLSGEGDMFTIKMCVKRMEGQDE